MMGDLNDGGGCPGDDGRVPWMIEHILAMVFFLEDLIPPNWTVT